MKEIMPNMNSVAITSKDIVSKKDKVLYVSHDEDGVWQFIGKDKITEDDVMVASLSSMLEIDPSLKVVLSLPLGKSLERSNTGEWE